MLVEHFDSDLLAVTDALRQIHAAVRAFADFFDDLEVGRLVSDLIIGSVFGAVVSICLTSTPSRCYRKPTGHQLTPSSDPSLMLFSLF